MPDNVAPEVTILHCSEEPVTLEDGTPFPVDALVAVLPKGWASHVLLRFEAQDGNPVVTQMGFGLESEATRGLAPVTAATLRSFPFESAVKQAVRQLATRLWILDSVRTPEGVDKVIMTTMNRFERWPEAPDQSRQVEASAVAALGRRSVTEPFLREVADTVRANPAQPTKAVQAKFFTSHRNATRWITAARKRGLVVDGFSAREGTK